MMRWGVANVTTTMMATLVTVDPSRPAAVVRGGRVVELCAADDGGSK
jgi:hypothetical protein